MTEQHLSEMAQRYFDKPIESLENEERRVLARIKAQLPISQHAADVADAQSTFGERLADRVARTGGSWGFIMTFGIVLVGWILLNDDILAHHNPAFDPYPYIFLNLILSMLAAIQAPIIMMSQNRQATKDRLAAGIDFEVNLRAELEIIRLHAKIDHALVSKLDALLEQQALMSYKLEQLGY